MNLIKPIDYRTSLIAEGLEIVLSILIPNILYGLVLKYTKYLLHLPMTSIANIAIYL